MATYDSQGCMRFDPDLHDRQNPLCSGSKAWELKLEVM